MAERRVRLIASPPDDAGHQGAFTRPGDLLAVHDSTPTSPRPPLHFDTSGGRPIERNAGLAWLIVMGMAALAAVLFWPYIP